MRSEKRLSARKNKPEAAKKAAPGPSVVVDAAVVFALALVVRLVYAAQVSDCPLYQMPTMDAGYYYALARQFAKGHWTHPVAMPYWQPPFYSMLLALWLDLAGTAVTTAKHAQFVLGSVNCALTMILGRRVFGRTVGLIAGIAAALYGPMVYFDGEFLTPTLQIFVNLAAILALMTAMEKKSLYLFAGTGALLGLSIITRPDVAVFAIAAVIWATLGLRREVKMRQVSPAVALMVACAVIPAAAITIRNATAGRDAALISTNGGINFYIGNNADYDRTVEIRPGPEWDAMQRMPRRELKDAAASQESAWFYRKGLEFIVRHPVSWAALTLKKTLIYLTAVEGRRDQDLYFYRDYSSLYSALVFKTRHFAFPLGLVLPLALIGLLTHKRSRESALLVWYLAAMLAVTVAFFVCARYRVTAVPVTLIFAASGAVGLWHMATERKWKRLVLPLAAAAVVLVISNANLYGVDRRQDLIKAEAHYSVAEVLCKREEFAAAAEQCRRAIELNPNFGAARLNYSRILSALGKPEEAGRQLTKLLKLDPNYAAAHSAIGELLAGQGDLPGARRHFITAARLDPGLANKFMQMSKQAFGTRDLPLAQVLMEAVVVSRPKDAEARCGLGMVLVARGQPREAIPHLLEACRLSPNLAGNFIALGTAYLRAGQIDEARAAFDQAIVIGPASEVRATIKRILNAAEAQ